jgi:hypothetical protein
MKTNQLRTAYYAAILCLITCFASGQPVIGGFNVYYGSLHNHTNVSDGTGTPTQAYAYARDNAHLDFFGLAEHANMMTSSEWTLVKNAANSYNQDGVFAAFYGFEWTTFLSYGHVAVINTDDYCSNTSSTANFSGLLNWLNARNGIAFFNHPGWESTAFLEFNKFSNTPSDKFVGMELWNDKDGFGKYYYNDGYYSNDGGRGYFDEALARGWKIGAAGSDDNHTSTWGTATNYRVGVLANSLSRTEILNAFLARRFFATIDKNISLSFKINGAEMGSTVTGGACNIVIQASDADNELFSAFTLIKNGAVYKTWLSPLTVQPVSENITCNGGDYFYVRVTQMDGNEAISSPVFISGIVNTPPTVSITNPLNGTSFAEGGIITISASAADADGSINRVEFYQGTLLLGTDTSSPYEIQWSGAAAGSYVLTAIAYDNLGASTTSAQVNITIIRQTAGSVKSVIASGNDDAEEYASGKVILDSDDIDLVYDSKTSGNQTVGLMFRNLNIPSGSTITKAYVQFTTDKRTTNTCNLIIGGESTISPAGFSTLIKNLSSRSKTTASVSWAPLSWSVVGSQGTAQQTPEIKSIIQEIVNISGWDLSSNLVILITGSGTRTAESYEGSAAKAASLYVEFAAPAGSPQYALKSTPVKAQPLAGELLSSDDIQVFPNPVSDKMNIRISGETQVDRIVVYTIRGSLIVDRKVTKEQRSLELDCSTLSPGTYLLSIQSNKGNYPFRFIKQ